MEARSTLRNLKNVKNVLASLSSSLNETIMGIEEYIHPFERGKGLASIPDEILSKIFEHAEENLIRVRITTKEKLSLVCRRFRRIVLKTPRLWSHIDSLREMRYVRTCLKRSRSAGLSIKLSIGQNDERKLDRLLSHFAEAIPHSSRWEHLDVYIGLTKTTSGIDLRKKILRSIISSDLHLPSLCSLRLDMDPNFFSGASDDNTRHFYQNWDMPNLRFLEISIVPKPIIAPKLSSFRLSGNFRDLPPSDKVRLRSFIASFPTLQELDVNLTSGGTSSGGQGSEQASEASTINMPHLRVLHIQSYDNYPRTDVRSFMRAFRTPVLHKVSIGMSVPRNDRELEEALDDFFPHVNYPALRDLSIEVLATIFPPRTLNLPTKRFRGLRSLSLDTPRLVPRLLYYIKDEEHIPALHTLAIANCDNKHLAWLTHTQTLLLQQKHWAGFKRLEISSALNFSSVREINTVFGGKDKDVVWKDRINLR